MRSYSRIFSSVLLITLLSRAGFGQSVSAANEQDVRREAAIAEFTQKTRAANYPALFESAAREFNVPADVLKGIAFAETRWEHLTWPPGETVSPESGMPRPFGIMSLWDNEYFGHSLLEAAALIGKSPEELKQDPLQNIRGAAALLRKLCLDNPRPANSREDEVESWRYAIRKYCGVPEPDLNAQHALKVYTFMNEGYHQYGIEWDGRPVNLELIRKETADIAAEEQAKRAAQIAANSPPKTNGLAEMKNDSRTLEELRSNRVTTTDVPQQTTNAAPDDRRVLGLSQHDFVWFVGGAFVAIIFFMLFFQRPAKKP
jgi:hypothetical protein